MPKVEQYGANRQNLSFTPGAQAPTRSLDKFAGAQLAQGLSDVSNTLNALQDDLSTTEAEDALVQYKRSVQDYSTNQDTGYLNTQGKDAVNGAKDASDALDELQKAHAAGLSGSAREKFLRVANGVTTATRGKYMAHAAQGQHDYKVATNKALQVDALETGAAETDPIERNKQLQLGLSHVSDGNDFNKITGVLAQKNLDDYKSAFHQSVMTEMVSQPGRAAEALAYFKAVSKKGELTPDAKVKMRELTKTAGLLEFTQNKTDEIITKHTDARSGLAVARKEKDPEKRKALVASVKARYDENKTLKNREVVDRTNNLLNRIEQEGYTATAADLHDLPESNRSAIAKAEKRKQTGEPVANNEEAYFNFVDSLRGMTQKQTTEALQNFFVNFSDKLDRAHLESAHKIATAALASFDKATAKQKALWSATGESTAIIKNLKVSKTKANRMSIAAHDAVQIATDAKGKPLTGAEQTDVINRAVNDVVLRPGFFPPEVTGYDKLNAAGLEDTTGILVETNASGELPDFSTFVFDKADQKELARLRRVFIGDKKHDPSHQELADFYVHVHGAQK